MLAASGMPAARRWALAAVEARWQGLRPPCIKTDAEILIRIIIGIKDTNI